MTTVIGYANEFDESLSYLISHPEDSLKYLQGDKIEYLSVIADNAFNAGIGAKSIALILFTVDEQFTKIDLSKSKNIDKIFNVILSRYAEQEASK